MKVGWKSVAAVLLAVLAGCSSESAKDTPADTAAAAAASTSDAARPTSGPADGRPTLLIVGTSLTAGLGLDPESAYPAVLQRKVDSAGIRLRIVNAGFSGETSAGALRRLEWLLRDSANIVMIETGANDGLRGQDVDSTRATLRAIVRRVKTVLPGATVLLAQMESPPNLGERYTTAFRAMFPAVARDEGITLLPFLLDGVAGVVTLNQADGIHPNEAGAKIVADNVFRAVRPVLERLISR
ncbi:MAG TPA: arylesterase [Gemmatimonadaceae bacterium]